MTEHAGGVAGRRNSAIAGIQADHTATQRHGAGAGEAAQSVELDIVGGSRVILVDAERTLVELQDDGIGSAIRHVAGVGADFQCIRI